MVRFSDFKCVHADAGQRERGRRQLRGLLRPELPRPRSVRPAAGPSPAVRARSSSQLGSTPGRVESAGARRQGKQCGRRKQFNVLASKYRRITLEQVTVAVLLDNFVGASAQMEQEKEAAEILRLKMSDPVRNSILIYIQD